MKKVGKQTELAERVARLFCKHFGTDHVENSSFVVVEACLPRSCVATRGADHRKYRF
jgi:hypothetical protein